ncbi:dihydrofolate reductase [bacterium]|nr:dihydrofolate reductase [bacterium]
MGFKIIVAVDAKRGIGQGNQLPWRLKGDMQWFKQTTISKNLDKPNCVIMGRKTWDSIPEKFRPLPERENIVITRHPEKCSAPNTADGLQAALDLAKSFGGDMFVIGGASIYAEAFSHPALEELIITEIEHAFECDAFFPEYSAFTMVEEIRPGEENGLKYSIKRYRFAEK